MIIQTAPEGKPHLAIMMYEHTALSGQFARAFGNERFEPTEPRELMVYVTVHHDAGWLDFDRDPVTGRAHHGHQPEVTRVQPAPSSLLRADVEHAQLGPLQRALRTLELRADR